MRKRLSFTAALTIVLWHPRAQAAPPDTSSMPQLVLPQATSPQDISIEPQFTFSVTAASNYIFRGVSQTRNSPAVFGTSRVSLDQFYAGFGLENVNFGNGIAAEYDLSAGWTPAYAGFRFDLGVIRYGYINEHTSTHIDTVDYKGVILHDFGPTTFGAAIYYTPNYFGSGHDGIYFEGRGTYHITDSLSASGAVGRQTVNAGLDHTTWNGGLNYAFIKNIALDLRYYDTNEHNLGGLYGSHFEAALTTSF